ncbi:MAG: TolC family protein, partial [Magnetospirillum sp.]|nr:TolC family protein [Magnetospirillum sp.]
LQFQIPASLFPAPPASVDDALALAMKANPDYLLSRRQMEVQELDSYKSYSRLMPKITFEYTKSRTWNADGSAIGGSSSSNDAIYPFQNETRAMIVSTWSINGGTEITQGLASAAKAREADFRSRDTRAKTEEMVRVSFNALGAARGRVPVLEEAVDSNIKVVAAFEEQYISANRPLFDLLDAYERQYGARQELTRVLVAEAQAGHQLRRLMGQLVEGLLETEVRANPIAGMGK